MSSHRVARLATAVAFAAVVSGTIGGGALHPTGAQAAFPNKLPYMCFTTGDTFHQTFGPASFYEGPPNTKPSVTFPLRQGTAAGHTAYYVITDASDQSVAENLGVNF